MLGWASSLRFNPTQRRPADAFDSAEEISWTRPPSPPPSHRADVSLRLRYLIYGLRDPRSGEIRYVGQSSTGMARPRSHANPAAIRRQPHLYVNRWLQKLKGLNLRFEIVVLQSLGADGVSQAALDEAERLAQMSPVWTAERRAQAAMYSRRRRPQTVQQREIASERARVSWTPKRRRQAAQRTREQRAREKANRRVSE